MPSIREMSVDEMIGVGINPIANSTVADNPLVEALLNGSDGIPQYDVAGRSIVSFRQYKQLRERDARMDKYALSVFRPGSGTPPQTIQASKYMKYWGQGYEIVGAPLEETHRYADTLRRVRIRGLDGKEAVAEVMRIISPKRAEPTETAHTTSTVDDDITLYFCKDKYPDCKRAFDNESGLKFHWRQQHGEAPIGKRRAARTEAPDNG